MNILAKAGCLLCGWKAAIIGSIRDGLYVVEEPSGATANRASPPHATRYYSRLLFVGKTVCQ